jgi:hypothetical protein
MAKSLSMYSITENIYYSHLASVALLLQPEPVSHRIIQGKDWVLSPYVLSSCGLLLPPTRLLVTGGTTTQNNIVKTDKNLFSIHVSPTCREIC